MSIKIIKPSFDIIKKLVLSEKKEYFSQGITQWLKMFGILYDNDSENISNDDYLIYLRGSIKEINNKAPFFLEGPVDQRICKKLNLKFKNNKASLFEFSFNNMISEWGIQIDTQKEIPNKRNITTKVSSIQNEKFTQQLTFKYHTFEPNNTWKPIAYARNSGEKNFFPVILSNGKSIISGLPIFDLAIRQMLMPSSKHGYFSVKKSGMPFNVQCWLIESIFFHAIKSNCTVARIHPWPKNYKSAITIRHDYDRKCEFKDFSELLSFYKKYKMKMSIGFLVNNIPKKLLKYIKRDAHEIALHFNGSNEKDLNNEKTELEKTIGSSVNGITIHGGIGSKGHLGNKTYEDCEKNNIIYTESLGRYLYLPHEFINFKKNKIINNNLIIIGAKLSLDRNTRPLGHFKEDLLRTIPNIINLSSLVNIMNHPDIHLHELKCIIKNLDLSNIWKATNLEIINWFKQTRIYASYQLKNENFECNFKNLDNDLKIDVYKFRKRETFCINKGTIKKSINLNEFKFKNAYTPIFESKKKEDGFQFMNFKSNIKPKEGFYKILKDKFLKIINKKQIFEQHQNVAIVVNSINDIKASYERMLNLKNLYRFAPQKIKYLIIHGGDLEELSEGNNCFNFFHYKSFNEFDLIILDSNVKIGEENYALNFLLILENFVNKDGKILISNQTLTFFLFPKKKIRIIKLIISRLFKVIIKNYTLFSSFKKKINYPINSILEWYFIKSNILTFQKNLVNIGDIKIEKILNNDLLREFLLSNFELDLLKKSTKPLGKKIFKENIKASIVTDSYLVHGMSYKAELINFIIKDNVKKKDNLKLYDVGGGFGALAGELILLNDRSKFNYILTTDINHQNLFLTNDFYKFFREEFKNKFFMEFCKTEKLIFDQSVDVICFIGSLLYVKKNKLKDVLNNSWNSLNPGGILIIHENIKNKQYKSDYNVMFAKDELDKILGQYAEIKYYSSLQKKKINKSTIKNQTLFRVIQK